MLTSSYVNSVSSGIDPYITQAGQLVMQMQNAASGISSYWNQLGSDLFEDNCRKWINQMNQTISSMQGLQSSLNGIEAQLYAEEEARRRAEEEARRQAEEAARRQEEEARRRAAEARLVAD